MTRIQSFFPVLFMVLFLTSCNNQKELYNEVMAIHDDAMPKMDNIMNLKQKLKKRADHLSSDTTSDFSAELQKIGVLQQQLDSADKSMMMWMREFHQDYETIAKAEITDYLNRQKQRITQVGLLINKAIGDAEDYLSAE